MSYQHILVPVDGSSTALAAVHQAAQLAKTYNSQVTILLVVTIDPFIGVEYVNAESQKEDAINRGRAMIQDILEEVLAENNLKLGTVLRKPIDGLVAFHVNKFF